MRSLLTALCVLSFAPLCFAQVTAPTAPTPPTAPTVTQSPAGVSTTPDASAAANNVTTPNTTAPTTATTTGNTAAPAPTQQQVMDQVQKMLNKKNPEQAVGQAVVLGILVDCTKKQAGAEPTQKFFNDMQAVGKQADAYCKQNQPDQARTLILNTVNTKRNDPVAKALLTCYDQNIKIIASMGGAQMAVDSARYANWLRYPSAAPNDIKTSDICKNKGL